MKKITVELVGGLGNQLFCYAFGRSICEYNGVELFIDSQTSYFKDQYGRNYLLDEFPNLYLNKFHVSRSSKKRFINKLIKKVVQLINGFIPLKWRLIVVEPFPRKYEPKIHSCCYKFNVLFRGYWASYLYFENIQDLLKMELSPPLPQSPFALQILELISASESCAIHWRSYKEDLYAIYNPLLVYYKWAVKIILKRHPNTKFFLFSDDYEMAEREFENIGCEITFMNNYPNIGCDSTLNDFYLIYACNHKIIGDSTFSWWAAWLSENENTTIIAPSGLSPWGQDWIPKTWISYPINVK